MNGLISMLESSAKICGNLFEVKCIFEVLNNEILTRSLLSELHDLLYISNSNYETQKCLRKKSVALRDVNLNLNGCDVDYCLVGQDSISTA